MIDRKLESPYLMLFMSLILLSSPPGCKGGEPEPAPEGEEVGVDGRPVSGPVAPVLDLSRIFEDPPLDGVRIRSVQWTDDGKRVGYLRPGLENREVLELWVWESGQDEARRLLRAEDVIGKGDVELSEEEILALERKRITERGITGYSWSPDGASVLVPLGGALYLWDVDGQEARVLDDGADGPLMDPSFSPDGSRVAFVRGGEIWELALDGSEARQLTATATETVTNGLAEFVAMEEMGRFDGYWWSPDGGRIAYIQVDESDVEIWHRASYGTDSSSLAEQRYPGAGRPNASTRIGILEVASAKTTWIALPESVEYIPRVGWNDDGSLLAVQVQPRDQKKLGLLGVDPATAGVRTLIEDGMESFVNLHDDLTFLEDGRIVWTSEKDGARQIYLFDADGGGEKRITDRDLPVVSVEAVDEESGLVIYAAVGNRSLEKHLFSIPLGGGEEKRLTPEGGWHDAEVAPDGKHFVDTFSSATAPQRAVLRTIAGEEVTMLEDNPTPDIEGWVRSTPEFIEVPAADGETMLQVSLTKPPGFDPGRPHPVIVYGYGGPHGHVVADRWRHNNIWGQFLAQNGYVVMSVDPRGSNYRGKAFEDAIWQKFSKVEIEDTAAVVRHMREEVWFDGENVGIWGWSYGGTLVIGSLLDTRDVYRCGAAVAPVTRWQWYDTHYTERYLGMPDDNPEVYTRANLLERDPAGLDERLLIVHGMADDNVFPRHSLALVSRLQDAGVQFDLMLYPGKTHLIAGKQTRAHLYGMMFAFFEKHLR